MKIAIISARSIRVSDFLDTAETCDTPREHHLLRMFASRGFRKPQAIAQFFWPMVLHRKLSRPFLSRALEPLSRYYR